MYRLMQPEDKPAVLALWQSQRNESEEFAKKAIEQFAGEQNVYVAEENDEIAAVALAVPVTLQGRSGTYLYGLCGEGSLILAGLVDYFFFCVPSRSCAARALRWRCPPARSRPHCCRIRALHGPSPCAACRARWSATCGARRSLIPSPPKSCVSYGSASGPIPCG